MTSMTLVTEEYQYFRETSLGRGAASSGSLAPVGKVSAETQVAACGYRTDNFRLGWQVHFALLLSGYHRL